MKKTWIRLKWYIAELQYATKRTGKRVASPGFCKVYLIYWPCVESIINLHQSSLVARWVVTCTNFDALGGSDWLLNSLAIEWYVSITNTHAPYTEIIAIINTDRLDVKPRLAGPLINLPLHVNPYIMIFVNDSHDWNSKITIEARLPIS